MESASPITALALVVGNGQSGCSRLVQMQNRPTTQKASVSQRFDLVPGRPWHFRCEFALAASHDDTFLPHCCLLAFVV